MRTPQLLNKNTAKLDVLEHRQTWIVEAWVLRHSDQSRRVKNQKISVYVHWSLNQSRLYQAAVLDKEAALADS